MKIVTGGKLENSQIHGNKQNSPEQPTTQRTRKEDVKNTLRQMKIEIQHTKTYRAQRAFPSRKSAVMSTYIKGKRFQIKNLTLCLRVRKKTN